MKTELYPGIAFSPQAALTDNIGAADTIIKVSDVSAFPPAPNLATIGTDEEGETVLYTAKTATALSGCRRGVEGTAKAWMAGELIGRNFTAKDHADLIAAVGETRDTAAAAREGAEKARKAIEDLEVTADTLPAGMPASVEKTAGEGHVLLRFGIPQGPQGETGPQGPPGETGPQGPQGPAGTNGVTSFNNRTGAVMPAEGDYTAEMVGAADKQYVDDAIRQAILDSWEGAY